MISTLTEIFMDDKKKVPPAIKSLQAEIDDGGLSEVIGRLGSRANDMEKNAFRRYREIRGDIHSKADAAEQAAHDWLLVDYSGYYEKILDSMLWQLLTVLGRQKDVARVAKTFTGKRVERWQDAIEANDFAGASLSLDDCANDLAEAIGD